MPTLPSSPNPHTIAAAATSALALAALPGLSGLPTASTEEPGQHCVLDIQDGAAPDQSWGDGYRCYETLEEALDAAGPPASAPGVNGSSNRMTAAASVALATHFDGPSRTGGSLTISGASCDAVVNLSASWTNRISSTQNYCGTVRFYEGYDKTGSFEVTGFSSVNLGALNNRSASIFYGA